MQELADDNDKLAERLQRAQMDMVKTRAVPRESDARAEETQLFEQIQALNSQKVTLQRKLIEAREDMNRQAVESEKAKIELQKERSDKE